MSNEAFEGRMARLGRWEGRVLDAISALEEVLLDPELGDYQPQREALLSALGWLEVEVTCGDCIEGRCHWGGERSRQSIAAVEAGGEYVDQTHGRCGCREHAVSVEARQRRARLDTLTPEAS